MARDQIKRINPPQNIFNDLYHYLIKMRWPNFIFSSFLLFVLLNLIFAYLYSLEPHSLGEENPFFKDYFFFSVQTFSTVGYGNLGPKTVYANILSSIEIFVGMLYMALTTGLVFSKFALPKSKILFTKAILKTMFDGEECLLFRIANGRSNKIMDAQLQMHVLYNKETAEGMTLRRFEELKLAKERTPYFSLSLFGRHVISQGPLAGMSLEELREKNAEFVISFKGVDETYGQMIHATHLYTMKELEIGGMFADILEFEDKTVVKINFDKFNKVLND